jgi:alcohol dehydrogenase class IV
MVLRIGLKAVRCISGFVEFTFHIPTKITFGFGSLQKLSTEVERLGGGRILVVTDKTMVKTGILARVVEKIEGRDYEVFDEVEPEPKVEVAERVAQKVRGGPFRLVLGVGGGSVLDMAKLAAGLATNQGDVRRYVGFDRFLRPGLPSIMIPTTAGTGSEVTLTAMVTLEGRKQWINSPLLLPASAVIDPELTLTMPRSVTASTGLDALSHCTEAVLSSDANVLTDAAALEGVSLIVNNLPRAYVDGSDRRAREAMSLAALLGGIALSARMVYGHSVAYTIATKYNLPHGVSCAIPLPYVIARYSEACREKMGRLARAYGVEAGADPVATGVTIAERVRTMISGFGLPTTLKELGVGEDELKVLARECLRWYPRANSPVVFDEESMLDFYRMVWSGSLRVQ